MRGERVQLGCDTVRQYQLEESTEEAIPTKRRRLLINIAQTADAEGDIAKLYQVFDALNDFPGADEVWLRVDKGDEIVNLEFPDMTTGYCPELRQRLTSLVQGVDLIDI